MHRTNIYLTERQEAALDSRARAIGVSRSELLRTMIDNELGLDRDRDEAAIDALRKVGPLIDDLSHSIFNEDPDLSIE